jgi:hypothetical protein
VGRRGHEAGLENGVSRNEGAGEMKKVTMIAFALSCLSVTAVAQAASPDDRLARGRAVEAVIWGTASSTTSIRFE